MTTKICFSSNTRFYDMNYNLFYLKNVFESANKGNQPKTCYKKGGKHIVQDLVRKKMKKKMFRYDICTLIGNLS